MLVMSLLRIRDIPFSVVDIQLGIQVKTRRTKRPYIQYAGGLTQTPSHLHGIIRHPLSRITDGSSTELVRLSDDFPGNTTHRHILGT